VSLCFHTKSETKVSHKDTSADLTVVNIVQVNPSSLILNLIEGDPDDRGLSQNQADRSLKITEASSSTRKLKLMRVKSSETYKRTEVFTDTDRNTIGSG